ncbi:MAG TPA: carboxypeptidase regulatory-like domain-containing protein [Pyrinomonadaceae bacterium]|jgi:outer membrane receptor protein involved in Fe transport|nr:carboxypeptidase regulatory-like domain-containing protein [Pyrinomonadaceae bacterium]
MSKFVKLSFVLLFILGLSAITFGQSTVTGAIGGVVTNPNKEVVPNASVTVRNIGTNKEDTAATDDEGRFKVSGLQPGNYSVTINGQGFSPYTGEVSVEIGRETTINAALSIGPVSGGTIEVTADAPVINTAQQDFSTNINQASISELPINGRRWSNFALLTPGAVPDGTFGLISFRGISGLLNNNTIDGGDNNQAFFAEERGRTRISYSISQSAIREFQVNTSSYSAEYGRSAGGVVNAVTKSGTNEFHGDAFYFQRNNKWGARNPLATRTVLVNGVFTPVGFKPEDVRHQFGGTIGGPIVKDKAFFFFSYDEQRRNFPGLSIFSSGTFLNLPAATRTAILARGVSGTQVDNALNFLQSLSGDLPRTGNQRLFLPKIDWNLNSKNTLTATYNRLRWVSPAGVQTQAVNTRARDNFGDDGVNIDSLNMRLASTINNTLINELRFQWGRDNEFQFSQAPLAGEPTNAVGGRSPQTFIQNGFTFGMPEFLERAAFPDERRYQIADTITLTAGNHTFKYGGDVNLVKDIINNLRFQGGEFNYTGANGLPDFIVDYTNFVTNGAIRALSGGTNGLCVGSARRAGKCYAGNFNQGFGVLGLTMKTTDLNFFLQDDWRVSPRLTLNLGVRYEYQRNPEQNNANPVLPQTRNTVNDRNNIGPRIGFALDVNGDGKTSLRGGWGLYYGRVINSTVYNSLVNTGVGTNQGQRQFTTSVTNPPPGCTTAVASLDNCASLPIYPNLLPASNPPVGAVQFFSSNFQLPQIHQFDLVFEREIARNTVVSASYLGSFGNSLPNFVDTNLPAPSRVVEVPVVGGLFNGQVYRTPIFTGPRPVTQFLQLTEIRSDVFSKYHALVLQANRRLTNGLQFQTSYTMSRSYDNGQSSVTFSSNNLPFNAFDQQNENGLSAFDRRQKLVASVIYNTNFKGGSHASRTLLNGWTFAPIFNAFSGARYTGTLTGSITPTAYGFASNTTPGGGINGSGGATRFGLLPRNFFKQPNIWYVDMRISRRFSLGESMKLELLAEGFNLFNRTQVTGVNATIYAFNTVGCPAGSAQCLTPNAPFQSVTGADSTLFRERQIQLAARFQF